MRDRRGPRPIYSPARHRHGKQPARSVALICAIAAILLPHAADAGTRVKHGTANRVFVMAGFHPDTCAFLGFPDMRIDTAPSKGQVTFKTGDTTTVQYSLSGNCIGAKIEGTGIYYMPAEGASGDDTFTITGRIGKGEPATRSFAVTIAD